MGSIYTHAARTSDTVSGHAIWALRATAQGRLHLRELGIFLGAATASTFGLGRPAAIGVLPTSAVLGQAEDSADAVAVGSTAVAWTTSAPTAPTSSIYLRRIGLPAAIGAGIIWTWPEGPGLIVPVSSEIVLYNLATNGVVDIYARWEE
jgi:hypothetical protein